MTRAGARAIARARALRRTALGLGLVVLAGAASTSAISDSGSPAILGDRVASSSAAPAAADPVWAALSTAGAVVILRHSFAPGGFDPPDARLDDCTTQRNLDEGGRAQARRIGEALRRQGIAVGRVRSSPRCRCLDTARLAFGQPPEAWPEAWEVLQGALNDAGRRQRQLAEIRQEIDAHRGGRPLVLVTHGSVVTDLTGLDVRMGELVVLVWDGAGRRVVAGRLYVD